MITSNTKSQHKVWIYVFRFSLCHYSCYVTKQNKLIPLGNIAANSERISSLPYILLESWWPRSMPGFWGIYWGSLERWWFHWSLWKYLHNSLSSRKKKKKDGILTSILTVERSLLVLFCILSSSQERMRYEENISAIDFHCLAFLSAAVLKALKTWLLKKPLEDGTDESKATFAICVTMLT